MKNSINVKVKLMKHEPWYIKYTWSAFLRSELEGAWVGVDNFFYYCHEASRRGHYDMRLTYFNGPHSMGSPYFVQGAIQLRGDGGGGGGGGGGWRRVGRDNIKLGSGVKRLCP